MDLVQSDVAMITPKAMQGACIAAVAQRTGAAVLRSSTRAQKKQGPCMMKHSREDSAGQTPDVDMTGHTQVMKSRDVSV